MTYRIPGKSDKTVMGGVSSSSRLNEGVDVRTHDSYFGANETDPTEVRKVRDTLPGSGIGSVLHRINDQGRVAGLPVQEKAYLTTLVSVGPDPPKMVDVNGCMIISFALTAQAPGRILVISKRMLNSQSFQVGEQVQISIPLPEITDFEVHIIPDLNQAVVPTQEDGFVVAKHVLVFRISTNVDIQYVLQRLVVSGVDAAYDIPMRMSCPFDRMHNPLLCMSCLTYDATVAIATCGHNIVCDTCLCEKNVRLRHCPICNDRSTF